MMKDANARVGANPKIAFMVIVKAIDVSIRNRTAVINFLLIDGKIISIIFIKSILSAKPHKAHFILGNGIDTALRQALFN